MADADAATERRGANYQMQDVLPDIPGHHQPQNAHRPRLE